MQIEKGNVPDVEAHPLTGCHTNIGHHDSEKDLRSATMRIGIENHYYFSLLTFSTDLCESSHSLCRGELFPTSTQEPGI